MLTLKYCRQTLNTWKSNSSQSNKALTISLCIKIFCVICINKDCYRTLTLNSCWANKEFALKFTYKYLWCNDSFGKFWFPMKNYHLNYVTEKKISLVLFFFSPVWSFVPSYLFYFFVLIMTCYSNFSYDQTFEL